MARYQLSPSNTAGIFRRTVRYADRPAKLFTFTTGVAVELDDDAIAFMKKDIGAGLIVAEGSAIPRKRKPEPAKLDALEDDPDAEPVPAVCKPLPSSRYGFGWASKVLQFRFNR